MFKNKQIFRKISKFDLMLRLAFYGLIALLSASFILTLWFLYQRFYLTLTQAEEILILKSQLAVENLDAGLFNSIKNREEEKTKAPSLKWEEIKDPFLPLSQ